MDAEQYDRIMEKQEAEISRLRMALRPIAAAHLGMIPVTVEVQEQWVLAARRALPHYRKRAPMTDWIQEREERAAATVGEIIARPMPESADMLGIEGEFSPWDIFPAIYGSYRCAFDKCALDVLTDLRDSSHARGDLASEIFKEMLCVADLCSYGTSPRACFATTAFGKILPALIEKWRAYARISWSDGWDQE